MPFIGNQPALAYTSLAKQDFTTSATTSYVLDNPVANANEIALFINFVRQEPTTAYTASGTTLTLTSATSATDDMYCVFLGKAVQTVNPPAGSVGTSQITDGAITSAKLASGVGGKVLQVVQGTSTTAFNTTSTTYANSSLSGVITPSSTSSKILVMVSQLIQTYNASGAYGTGRWKIIKTIGATTTDVTDVNSTSNGNLLVYDYGTSGISVTRPASLIKLDTPNTTSEITYRTQAAMGSNGGSNVSLADNTTTGTIILMEIAG